MQGGGYYPNKTSNITVPLEYRYPNENWTVGLARDSLPDSGSSEYFINLANNTKWLGPGGSDAYGYCVFARVVKGFEVVDRILTHPTHYSKKDETTLFNKPWPLIHYIHVAE
jgi:cyclophilin family peptidyl-prolyl cis-trans isomerase